MFALDLSYLGCPFFLCVFSGSFSNFRGTFFRPISIVGRHLGAMRRFATKVGLQLRGFEQPNSGGRVAVKDRCSFEDHVRCRTFIGASMKR